MNHEEHDLIHCMTPAQPGTWAIVQSRKRGTAEVLDEWLEAVVAWAAKRYPSKDDDDQWVNEFVEPVLLVDSGPITFRDFEMDCPPDRQWSIDGFIHDGCDLRRGHVLVDGKITQMSEAKGATKEQEQKS